MNKKNGLWFISEVIFNVPSDDIQQVQRGRGPFEFIGSSWGTLIVEITICFRHRFRLHPFQTEFELDFSCSGKNSEQCFVINLNSITADKFLQHKRNRGWRHATQEPTSNETVDTKPEDSSQQQSSDQSLGSYVSIHYDKPNSSNQFIETKSNQGLNNFQFSSNFQPPNFAFPTQTFTPQSLSSFQFPTNQPNQIHFQPQNLPSFHFSSSSPKIESSKNYYDCLSKESLNQNDCSPYDSDEPLNSEDEEEILALSTISEDELQFCYEVTKEEADVIRKFLQHFNLQNYAEIFIQNGINPESLQLLTPDDLHGMGIHDPVICSQLLKLFSSQHPYYVYIPDSNIKKSSFYREISFKELQIEEDVIASGYFGEIYRARWRGQLVAVKKLKHLKKDEIEELRREAAITERVSPIPFIIKKNYKLVNLIICSTNEPIYIFVQTVPLIYVIC